MAHLSKKFHTESLRAQLAFLTDKPQDSGKHTRPRSTAHGRRGQRRGRRWAVGTHGRPSHAMEGKSEVTTDTAMWVDLENVLLSQRLQTQNSHIV